MMKNNKMTQKVIEAINDAHSLAIKYSNQAIGSEHLFMALLNQENGILSEIFEALKVNISKISEKFEHAVSSLPKVTTAGRPVDSIYVTPRLDKLLNTAEEEAKNLKDEYISVEHILLAE